MSFENNEVTIFIVSYFSNVRVGSVAELGRKFWAGQTKEEHK
jgi:hypothetical protein